MLGEVEAFDFLLLGRAHAVTRSVTFNNTIVPTSANVHAIAIPTS